VSAAFFCVRFGNSPSELRPSVHVPRRSWRTGASEHTGLTSPCQHAQQAANQLRPDYGDTDRSIRLATCEHGPCDPNQLVGERDSDDIPHDRDFILKKTELASHTAAESIAKRR